MDTTAFQKAALFEHRFWLQIMGDHARFILEGLAPAEVTEIQRARRFIHVFDRLLEVARHDLSEEQLANLTHQAAASAAEIRSFKLHLLRRHLCGEIAIHLPPTFINHMVNEAEEYLRLLQSLLAGVIPPPCHPLHYHLLWLPDAAGHAGSITNSLDMVEKQLRAQSEAFTLQFEQLFLKAMEMAGYLRAHLASFPALSRFNSDVEVAIGLFSRFLRELEEWEMDERILGNLAPLMLDHMAREECYYLTSLARATDGRFPECDPTAPRNEGREPSITQSECR